MEDRGGERKRFLNLEVFPCNVMRYIPQMALVKSNVTDTRENRARLECIVDAICN